MYKRQDQDRAFHIDNLDAALRIIAKIGTLYNGLQQQDQKELLRQMVERVVVNHEGKVRLELRAPFAYLKDLTDEVRTMNGRSEVSRLRQQPKNKTGGEVSPASRADQGSTWIQFSWKNRNLSEPLIPPVSWHKLQRMAYPQAAHLARFSTSL